MAISIGEMMSRQLIQECPIFKPNDLRFSLPVCFCLSWCTFDFYKGKTLATVGHSICLNSAAKLSLLETGRFHPVS